MNTLLTCDMHIIVCNRAREKVKMIKNAKGQMEPESIGGQPICEKNFLFEMTVSFMIHDEGRRREILKCPADLQSIINKPDGYLGAKEGLALRQWVDGAKQLDPDIERARNTILSHASEGLESVNAIWQELPAKTKKGLGQQFIDMARASAEEFDRQAEERGGQGGDDLDMSSGGFDPLKPTERETVPAHVQESPPISDDDPFAE
jgi:hypothetical protein